MFSGMHSFIHFAFIGFIALFPVVNPVGVAFILSPYFSNLTFKERLRYVKKITFNAFIVCVFTLFAGRWILELFGITIPIIQLAGGIMICKIGWEFLTVDKQETPEGEPVKKLELHKKENIEGKLFYPITFPMTTGAGTVAVLFTLSAHSQSKTLNEYFLNTGALIVSIVAICILIFISFLNANSLLRYIGSHNEQIINRVMAFLIFAVGLQIAIEGITQLIK
jgi:multiple antibiotic resistance protein